MGEIILTMKGIDKSFPGVHALDHVDLEVRKGEVLALMGENGAGKSTLMKVLTGIYKKDSGTITYEGKEVEFKNRDRFIELGLTIAALRKMQGMSQEKLAEKAHMSRSHLSSIEAPNIIRPFSLEIL